MKIRNYEKNITIKSSIIIVLILEILFTINLMNNKIATYQQISTIVLKRNVVTTIISSEDRKLIYNNSKLFLKDKKIKYKIIEDHGIIIERNKKDYYEIVLEFEFDKDYKPNDTIIISLNKKRKRLIEIFKLIWDGD